MIIKKLELKNKLYEKVEAGLEKNRSELIESFFDLEEEQSHTFHIRHNKEYGEYKVHHPTNPKAHYYTDDKKDAEGTAHAMAREMKLQKHQYTIKHGKALKEEKESIENVQEGYNLNKDHKVEHDNDSHKFAKHYVKAHKGDHRKGGPSQSDQQHSEHFWSTYNHKTIRNGFAGSGTSEYTHKKTGEKYKVEKTSNGKGFYGTTHSISKIKESAEGKKHFIEPVNHGYGKEYSVYHGTENEHRRGHSDWIDTVKTKKHAKEVIKNHKSSLKELDENTLDVFFDETSQNHYYIELNEETLEERKIIIRVNSKGQKRRLVKCPKGRIVKTVNGRKVCVNPTGRQKMTKRLAIRKGNRTKNAKGTGYKKRVNFRRQRALRKRKQLGVRDQG